MKRKVLHIPWLITQEGNMATLRASSFTAFGELRTANPGNRSDQDFTYDLAPLFFDDISAGAGSLAFNSNLRAVEVKVNGTNGSDVGGIRQHAHIPYTAGNGQQIDVTGTLDYAGIGGGTPYIFLRQNLTGTPQTTTKGVGEWLIDPSDINWKFSQIFAMQFQSLRVGTVAFGLVRNGDFVPYYYWNNDNVRNSGYWQSPTLPPYWKVYHSGGNTISEIGYGNDNNAIGFQYVYNGLQATAKTLAICETVKSQGGVSLFDLPGVPFVTPRLASPITVSTSLIPVVSIRMAATFQGLENRTLAFPTSISLQTDNPISWGLYYRPTLTNAAFTAINSTYNSLEYDITASAITGGYEIDGDNLSAGNNQPIHLNNLLQKIPMALGYTGTADILTLAAIRTGATNASVRVRIKGTMIS